MGEQSSKKRQEREKWRKRELRKRLNSVQSLS